MVAASAGGVAQPGPPAHRGRTGGAARPATGALPGRPAGPARHARDLPRHGGDAERRGAGAGKHYRPAHHPRRAGGTGQGAWRRLRHLGRRGRHLGHARPGFGLVPARAAEGRAMARQPHRRRAARLFAAPPTPGNLQGAAGPVASAARTGRQARHPAEPDERTTAAAGRTPAERPGALPRRGQNAVHRPRPVGRPVAENQPAR